jgi:hypothetical protein
MSLRSFFLSLFFFYLGSLWVQAQKHFVVQLEIDMQGIDSSALNGTFALHSKFRRSLSSSFYEDTLLLPIILKKNQCIHIPAANNQLGGFHLQFTPNQTELPSRINYLYRYHYGKDTITVALNSYFFNQSPPSFLDDMREDDLLVFHSQYSGMSHEMMLIPHHSLSIYKKENQYYAFYSKQELYSHNIGVVHKDPISLETLTIDSTIMENRILLDSTHLALIRQFEATLWEKVYFDEEYSSGFPPNKSRISLRQKHYLFRADGHIGLELWKNLQAQEFLNSLKNNIFDNIKNRR